MIDFNIKIYNQDSKMIKNDKINQFINLAIRNINLTFINNPINRMIE